MKKFIAISALFVLTISLLISTYYVEEPTFKQIFSQSVGSHYLVWNSDGAVFKIEDNPSLDLDWEIVATIHPNYARVFAEPGRLRLLPTKLQESTILIIERESINIELDMLSDDEITELLKGHLKATDHIVKIKFIDNIGEDPGPTWRWEEGYRYNAMIISRYPLMAISTICAIILVMFALYYGRIAVRKRKEQCIKCGYSLQGLPTPTCPECGFEKEKVLS